MCGGGDAAKKKKKTIWTLSCCQIFPVHNEALNEHESNKQAFKEYYMCPPVNLAHAEEPVSTCSAKNLTSV